MRNSASRVIVPTLAQMVERWTVESCGNPTVAGSNPAGRKFFCFLLALYIDHLMLFILSLFISIYLAAADPYLFIYLLALLSRQMLKGILAVTTSKILQPKQFNASAKLLKSYLLSANTHYDLGLFVHTKRGFSAAAHAKTNFSYDSTTYKMDDERLQSFNQQIDESNAQQLMQFALEVSTRNAMEFETKAWEGFWKSFDRKLNSCIDDVLINDACLLLGRLKSSRLYDIDLWEKLSGHVVKGIYNSEATITVIAEFMFLMAETYGVPKGMWENAESVIEDNHQQANYNEIAKLFYAYILQSQSQNIDRNTFQNSPTTREDIRDSPFFGLMITLIMERIPNFDIESILIVGRALRVMNYEKSSIWDLLEARAEELFPRAETQSTAELIHCFGVAGKGSEKLWINFEEYFIEAGQYLPGSALTSIVLGFGYSGRGGNYFWDRVERYIIDSQDQIEAVSAIQAASGFSKAKQGSVKLWEVLDNALVKNSNQVTYEAIASITKSFGDAGRGSAALWNILENVIVGRGESVPLEEKIASYAVLYKYSKLTPVLETVLREAAFIKEYVDKGQYQYR